MPSLRRSSSNTPRVTKLSRHGRRRSLNSHISTLDVATNHHSPDTKSIVFQNLDKQSSVAPLSISVTKIQRHHHSLSEVQTEDVKSFSLADDEELKDNCSISQQDTGPNTTQEQTNMYRESTRMSAIREETSFSTMSDETQRQVIPSELNLDLACTMSTRTDCVGGYREILYREKKRKRRKLLVDYCCMCAPYTFWCVLGVLLFAFAITAILIGVFIKTKLTTSTIAENTTSNATITGLNVNLITNGGGETGPCANGTGVTSPTGWTYNGPITQIYYNNSANIGVTSSIPGPSDRGQCYFYGQISTSTSMWQTMNLTSYVDPLLIDAQMVMFNLSAWLGGYTTQNDNAMVSLTFADQGNQVIGNSTSIGPVLATDRGSLTSFVFRQANGLVPAGARFATVIVTITLLTGTTNNGDVDNVGFFLYQ